MSQSRSMLLARRTITSTAAAGCLLAGVVGAASATPRAAVTPPKVLSHENVWAEGADVAVRPDGSAIAVWTEATHDGDQTEVMLAQQDSAGRWTDPTTLSNPNANASGPKVATNGNQIAVTWQQGNEGAERVMVKEFDTSWTPAKSLSTPGSSNAVLAMGVDGRTSVSWLSDSPSKPTAVEFAQETRAGDFRVQQLTDGNESAVSQSLAINENGDATVVWYSDDDGYQVRAANPSNESKTRPTTLSHSTLSTAAVEPGIAIRGGKTMAVWQEITGESSQHIAYATMTPGGKWSDAVQLPEADDGAANPQIGIDDAGRATVLWIKRGACDQGMVSQQLVDGSWKPAERITESDRDNNGLRLDVAPDGQAVASWPGIDPNVYPYQPPVQVNVRDANGSWQGIQTLSTDGSKVFDPIAKINSDGQIAAIWSLGNGESTSRVEATTALSPR